MAYLTQSELERTGFRALGRNVRISTRAAIYNPEDIELGDHVRIDDFCVVSGRVVLERNVHLTVFCNLAGGQTGVFVGAFSGFAYGCHVFAQSDDLTGPYLSNQTVPAEFKNETRKPVRIARHCCVGTNSVVVPGVAMAEGTSVYAASLVTRSTEPWSVYFGRPARRIGRRTPIPYEMIEAYLHQDRTGTERESR